MHAYLITGDTKENRVNKAREFLEKNSTQETLRLQTDSTHAIKSIRELNKSLSLRPPGNRGVVIEEAQLLTTEAANSFLKTLEEPPEDTIIILTAPNRDLVLETISSRCQHIELVGVDPRVDPSEIKEAQEILNRLLKGGIAERFSVADVYSKNRNEALKFVTSQIFAARELLFNRLNNKNRDISPLHLIELLEMLDQTRQDLEANVNVKLAIYNLLLHYPRI